jgi:asparagine synthetase B (glutamine-hydrolysing)
MAASVEARVPFQDVRIAKEALGTPGSLLLGADGQGKQILRLMARRHRLLPEQTVARKKFGASIAGSWIETSPSFRSFARDVVLDSSGWTARLGLQKPMEEFFLRGRKGYRPPSGLSVLSVLAWRLLMLNLWARHYLAAAGTPAEGGLS